MKKTMIRQSAMLFFISGTLAAQQFTHPGPIGNLSAPILMDTLGFFQAVIARVGDDIFIAGQPTERGLKEMRSQGVTTVVNLRSPQEMALVSFDEAAVVASLGMHYVYVPVRGDSAFPYTPAALAKFTDAVKNAGGKVLLHCTVSWRASHLWAAYLIQERGVPLEAALANGHAINLVWRATPTGPQPIEDFLNRKIPALTSPPFKQP